MDSSQRVTFSPGEFATLFGKSQTWGYRQIYAGKVKAITEYGRILIPAAEVERILATAGIYDGLKPKPSSKKQIQQLAPKLQSAWAKFVAQRRAQGETPDERARRSSAAGVSKRQQAIDRLARKRQAGLRE